MKISDILDKHCIRVPLMATEKAGAIAELVELLNQSGYLTDRDAVLEAILARERTRSTGIGLGLAVPHGKSNGCRRLAMAVGKSTEPMEFEALDGRPCQFIVLLTSPVDETGPHIQALAGVSRLWQKESFRRAALAAETGDEIYAIIQNAE